ncbi:MAG: 3-hydroxyacyl-CoA dehydrogenase family protein [Spirochaetales bacterium]|nr:3-hydroxyacyl-CoA dehydrogenase family protein [Spirochaetales bacterium]
MEIKNPAIIGAGTMGSDIALDLASYNYKVTLLDISTEALIKSKDKIEKGYNLAKMMKSTMRSITLEQIFEKINFTIDYEDLKYADLVIENVTEDFKTKKEVLSRATRYCQPGAIFAINTSCISITKIASFLPEPQQVAGVHFMNPVPLKNIVETIRGYHTSDETIQTLGSFLKTVKKSQVVVKDYPGFVVNRLSHLFMNEAAYLVQDAVAEPKEIDILFEQGYGHKMGPLKTADLIGLDTVLHSLNVLYESYQDPKFRSCPLLVKMVDAGLLGIKSGQGFYKY